MIILTLYRVLWWILLPGIVVMRFLRDWRSPLGVQNFRDRFGFQKVDPADLLIHAVSLGEVRAVTPLVKRLLADFPNKKILFTATTLTGSEQIQRSFKEALASGQLAHTYLPLDFGPSVAHFLQKVSPKATLIMETEIWPNLLWQAQKKNIPVFIISACLSDRSYRRYLKIKPSMDLLLRNVTVLAQTDEDVLRFEILGVHSAKKMGNIKYDLTVAEIVFERLKQLQQKRTERSLYWIAASTHETEEEIVIESFIKAKKTHPHLQLILAPRHPERFLEVTSLLEEYVDAHDFSLSIRSQGQLEDLDANADIWLVDTLGELLLFYAFADIALVGGSFVPIGGHNILEPAFFEKPILVGPFMDENREILKDFLRYDAIIQTDNEQLAKDIMLLVEDDAKRISLGNAARTTMAKNQGALDIVIQEISPLLQ
ncbi:3-deoxy-D-manno-octulosonic acid transferase [Ignatzschineria sp. LJL83]